MALFEAEGRTEGCKRTEDCSGILVMFLFFFFTIIILILGFFKVEVSLNYSIVLVVF